MMTANTSPRDKESPMSAVKNHLKSESQALGYYNANPYPVRPYYDPERATCGRLVIIVTVISLVIAAGIICTLMFFFLICSPQVHLKSASISGFDFSSSPYNGSLNISLSFTNPNKLKGIMYNYIDIVVLYRKRILTHTTIRPFFQDKKDTATIPAVFMVSTGNNTQIATDRKLGQAHFELKFEVGMKYSSDRRHFSKQDLRIGFCRDVTIEFKSAVGTKSSDPFCTIKEEIFFVI